MRNLKWSVYSVLVLMTGSVVAAQVTIDEDYMQVMEDRQKSLTSNLARGNAQAANEDVKELKGMFNDVEEFYLRKGNAADAVTWTKESKELADNIEKSVASKDFDKASQSSAVLAKTCKSCHRVYKKEA